MENWQKLKGAIDSKGDEQRRDRQAQGIDKAKTIGRWARFSQARD